MSYGLLGPLSRRRPRCGRVRPTAARMAVLHDDAVPCRALALARLNSQKNPDLCPPSRSRALAFVPVRRRPCQNSGPPLLAATGDTPSEKLFSLYKVTLEARRGGGRGLGGRGTVKRCVLLEHSIIHTHKTKRTPVPLSRMGRERSLGSGRQLTATTTRWCGDCFSSGTPTTWLLRRPLEVCVVKVVLEV